MTVSQFIVAITGTVAGTEDLAAQRAAIAFVCIYIYFFASSWGPVAWVVTGWCIPLLRTKDHANPFVQARCSRSKSVPRLCQ
jgi:Sugar (and other) transporter